MFRNRFKAAFLAAMAALMLLAGCYVPAAQIVEKEVTRVVVEKEAVEVEKEVTRIVERLVEAEEATPQNAKYVFLFIGDGMAVAQRNVAELYLRGRRVAGTGPRRPGC